MAEATAFSLGAAPGGGGGLGPFRARAEAAVPRQELANARLLSPSPGPLTIQLSIPQRHGAVVQGLLGYRFCPCPHCVVNRAPHESLHGVSIFPWG